MRKLCCHPGRPAGRLFCCLLSVLVAVGVSHGTPPPPPPPATTTISDVIYRADVTSITSTTLTIDAGAAPSSGGGIEVRRSDFGWGQQNDRNLVGRFTTQTFTVTRLSRIADFCLRQYDASLPPRYSRYSTALHVDYPL